MSRRGDVPQDPAAPAGDGQDRVGRAEGRCVVRVPGPLVDPPGSVSIAAEVQIAPPSRCGGTGTCASGRVRWPRRAQPSRRVSGPMSVIFGIGSGFADVDRPAPYDRAGVEIGVRCCGSSSVLHRIDPSDNESATIQAPVAALTRHEHHATLTAAVPIEVVPGRSTSRRHWRFPVKASSGRRRRCWTARRLVLQRRRVSREAPGESARSSDSPWPPGRSTGENRRRQTLREFARFKCPCIDHTPGPRPPLRRARASAQIGRSSVQPASRARNNERSADRSSERASADLLVRVIVDT